MSNQETVTATEVSGARIRGRVLWFDTGRGFGFIRPEGWSKDLFCHHTQLQMDGFRHLEENQIVEFELGKHNGKLQADKVVVVED